MSDSRRRTGVLQLNSAICVKALCMRKHDALNYLPSTRILEFPRRSVIYEPPRSTSRLYLVLAGRVKILCDANSGAQILLRIAGAEEFFGEGALVPLNLSVRQSAVAIDPVQVMCWTAEEVQ